MTTLSDSQIKLKNAIFRWYGESSAQEFYVAGWAGTGKTTIAAQIIKEMGSRTCVAVFTGKAASVLRSKGLGQASTIHSLIYEKLPGTEPPRWIRSPLSPLADASLLVVDEVSMVSDEIADDLRSYGRKILVLGDPGQLPPIRGAGAFTRNSPDFFLTEIHRQAAESPILKMATLAREGKSLESAAEDDRARIVRLGRTELLAGAERGQVICGTHRSRWGATALIRKDRGFASPVPGVGERVICRRNDRELGLYNGMLGVVEEWYEDDDEFYQFRVRMDDLEEPVAVVVDPTLFREHETGRGRSPFYRRGVQLFDFGYVITCHSAQGSEWPEVTIVDDSGSFREERHRWLYTALTRASERVTLLRRG